MGKLVSSVIQQGRHNRRGVRIASRDTFHAPLQIRCSKGGHDPAWILRGFRQHCEPLSLKPLPTLHSGALWGPAEGGTGIAVRGRQQLIGWRSRTNEAAGAWVTKPLGESPVDARFLRQFSVACWSFLFKSHLWNVAFLWWKSQSFS